MEEFDFVVIGAGPSGCVVASRLSEDPSVSAVLLEAGPGQRSGILATNSALATIVYGPKKSAYNWGFETEADPGLNNRKDYHVLGRGLGGGTQINTLMYMRGNSKDYDRWADLGNPGWGWNDVLPYFKKSEDNRTFNDEFHGKGGPVWVEELRTDNPYHDILRKACNEAGWPHNPDLNGKTQEGFRCTQVMMKNGERHHAGQAFILPHLDNRPNLKLYCDTHVARILFEGKRAVGVEVVCKGERRQIRARKEVIVSAGGILSAQLLKLSGVGDKAELQKHGIAQVHQLPAVGKHLHDHIDVVLGHHIPGDPNLMGISPTAVGAFLKGMKRWKKERRGMFTTNYAEVTGFMSLTPESPKPEIQYEFVVVLAMDHGRDMYWKHGMSTHILLLDPKSRGTVTLASNKWEDFPLVDFKYFSHPDDLQVLVEGTRRVAKVYDTPTMKSLVKRDLITENCKTHADWEQFCRNGGGTNYHPVGSCRMGPDPMDNVVDHRLKVHGLEGIRVIDSSIFPAIMSGNTTAPTYMVGEKGVDMIKADWR